MQLAEAISKATKDTEQLALHLMSSKQSLGLVEAGREFNQQTYNGSVQAFVSRCGAKFGDKVIEQFGPQLLAVGDEQIPEEIRTAILDGTTDRCYLAFAMGYVLGAPEWDSRDHTKETYVAAFTETDPLVLKALVTNFKTESALREEFHEKIDRANVYIIRIFSQLNAPRSEKYIGLWSSYTCSIAMYAAFHVGLRTRQILEENLIFEQITQPIEE